MKADPSGSETIAPEASIGRYLGRERELRGISLDELAELTKLPRRSLERLEAGAYDQRSDGFARGFARTVALALGLRSHETMARMSPETFASSPRRRRLQSLSFLRHLQIAIVASVLLACATLLTFWVRGDPVEPEPLVYRRDALRSLWVRERNRLPLPVAQDAPQLFDDTEFPAEDMH